MCYGEDNTIQYSTLNFNRTTQSRSSTDEYDPWKVKGPVSAKQIVAVFGVIYKLKILELWWCEIYS